VDGQITALYSLCDDVLKTLPHAEDPPRCGSAAHQCKKLESQGQG
jgi:hypothetical protein